MLTPFVAVLLTLAAADIVLPVPTTPRSWTRTRPLSPTAISLLAEATERSSIVASLLATLEQSDVVVYVTDSMPVSVGGPTSHMVFVSRDESTRYLLVRIDRFKLSPPERIVSLGHELQHAVEVATATDVNDAQGMARLYRRIGWEGRQDKFETEGAQTIGHRVRSEISRRTP